MCAKPRTDIPKQIAAEVQWASDRTCCVCQERGKRFLQLHHIDEDPSNHTPANLAVLCLECHAETQVVGGPGRKLDAHQIRLFKTDWEARVVRRRELADRLLMEKLVKGVPQTRALATKASPSMFEALIALRKSAQALAQNGWDTGVTSEMIQSSYDYIDILLKGVLMLASCYPAGHFSEEPSSSYFNELITSRFEWHRAVSEPHGAGTGGTIINLAVCGSVMADVEAMIVDLVRAVGNDRPEFDFLGWKKEWETCSN